MIYLIGGPPRVGKSTLARMLLDRRGIPFVPTDALFHMLRDTNPTPIVSDKTGFKDKASDFYPYLREFIKHLHWSGVSFTVEGDSFLPEQVYKLLNDSEFIATKIPLKICFLGMSHSTKKQIKTFMGNHGWLKTRGEKELDEIARDISKRSQFMERESKKYGYSYFDISTNYQETLEKAYLYLIGNEANLAD